jgi:hypothetical protein
MSRAATRTNGLVVRQISSIPYSGPRSVTPLRVFLPECYSADLEWYSVSEGQPPPLTVRLPDDLRARIDEQAERLGVSRNAWIVQALLTELGGAAPAPKSVGRERPSRPDPRARIMPTGSYAFRAVDVATGDTIEGTVRNMRRAAEDEARRLGYEVVDS